MNPKEKSESVLNPDFLDFLVSIKSPDKTFTIEELVLHFPFANQRTRM